MVVSLIRVMINVNREVPLFNEVNWLFIVSLPTETTQLDFVIVLK